ncbi:MAG: hypothetical protein V2A79_15550, partial [Planctomycetota bacterium]
MKFREAETLQDKGLGLVLSTSALTDLRFRLQKLYATPDEVFRANTLRPIGKAVECEDGGFYAPFKVELHPVSAVSEPEPVTV